MQRVRRFRVFIIAAMACAILLGVAAFSVSYAKWTVGESEPVQAQGSVGQFYVEYPRFTDSEEVLDLDPDTYYIQTIQKNNAGEVTSYSYYPMSLHDELDQGRKQYTVQLDLNKDALAYLYKGDEPYRIAEQDGNLSSSDGTFEDGKFTAAKTARYTFYFKEGVKSTEPTEPTTPTEVPPTRDLTKNSVKVNFKDGVSVVFEMGSDINGGTTRFHIWKQDVEGLRTVWPGLTMNKTADAVGVNVHTFDFPCTDVIGIILNNGDGKQVGDSTVFYDALFKPLGGLKANYKYTITPKSNTWWNDFTSGASMSGDTIKSYFTVIETPPSTSGGGSTTTGNTKNELWAGVATTTVATPSAVVQSTAALHDTMDVRKLNGKTVYDDQKDGFVYKNYICVSRRNHIGDDDNSLCFVEFAITGADLDVPVKSITITRSETDENGKPTGGKITPAPRLYNYDPTAETKLSDIGHGAWQMPTDPNKHMVQHYNDGMYCILFFADNAQQFFALDIEIVTTREASFTLTATASNINHWQRYESGYGEPWGFYMGGLINNVWLWDPRRTTKMNIESGAVEVNPDGTPKEGTYNTVDFDGVTATYPSRSIDLTLTVNLVGNSLVKMYMLDESGHRLDGATVYLLPNEVICTPDNMFDGVNMFDTDLNLKIPVSGEYSFRLVGNVHLREETVNGKSGTFMSIVDGSRASSKVNSNYIGIPNFNLVVDKLYISRSDGNASNTVTFDAGSGKFADGQSTFVQEVRFGNNVVAPAEPANDDPTKRFDGWYTDAACTVEFDFNTPVTSDITLHAKWVGKTYSIMLNANGGKIGSADAAQRVTDTSGRLTDEQLVTPTRTGYTFTGWNTSQDGTGDPVTSAYEFTANGTIWAQWEEKTATATFYYNDDFHGSATYKTLTVSTVTKPEDPELGGHDFGGWYTDAACTKAYTFGGTIENDIDLYAKWTGAGYSVGSGTTLTALTKGTGTDNPYTGTIEMRTGKAGALAVGTSIKVFYNGKQLSDLDDANARVTVNADKSITLGKTNQSAAAQGKFTIKAHYNSSTKKNTVDIKFVGGDAADQIGQEITAGSAANAGYYVIGGFSNWSVYKANKMTATNVEGIYTKTLSFVIPGSGEYKIVEVPTSGSLVWYDKNGVGGGSGGNGTIPSTTFYVDTFKKGTSSMFPTSINTFYRIILNKAAITWSSFGTPVQIHYWDSNINVGSDQLSNWSGDNSHNNWNNKKTMTYVSAYNYYYYDVPVVTYNGEAVKLTGVIILFKDNSSVMQSQDLLYSYQAGYSYRFGYANWGSSLGASWNGSNWWAVKES